MPFPCFRSGTLWQVDRYRIRVLCEAICLCRSVFPIERRGDGFRQVIRPHCATNRTFNVYENETWLENEPSSGLDPFLVLCRLDFLFVNQTVPAHSAF